MMAKLTEIREKLISKKKDNKGFTLVELIVVIVILAILVGVTIGGVYGYVAKSRTNTDINNASAIESALQVITTSKDATGTLNATDTAFTIDNSAAAKTSADVASALGITSEDGIKKVKEILPDGVPMSKDKSKLVGKYSTDNQGHFTSISLKAVDSTGSALEAKE